MAVIGEKIADFVKDEINWRQTQQYKGFDKGSSRNASTLQYLNNQNAWVKMASSVYIGGAGTEKEIKLGNILSKQRLDSIGLEYSKFKGNNLAKNFILFNGVSEVNKPNKRAGITNNTQLWNSNSAYGLGGTQFGIQPIPGITGVDVECLNRGSIRRATITLQAFNKFQFEIIEMLYLRVGYHIMLEFGNDKYFDHETKTYESTGNTLIEKSWFNSTNTTQLGMLKEILTERKKYSGNYEGFFGRVTNFSWDITPEGTYSIEINLHTVGDVIESIQVNLPTPILTDADLIKSGSNSAIDTSVQNIIDATLYNAESDKCEDELEPSYITLQSVISSKDKEVKNEEGEEAYDDILKAKDQYTRFVQFGTLLANINRYCIPRITPKDGNPSSMVEINTSPQLMGYYNNQTPLDPRVCIFKIPSSTNPVMEGLNVPFNNLLPPFLIKDPNNNEITAGNIMNLYLNFAFVKKCMRQNVDKKGKLSLFKLLSNLCDGINSSLGGVNNLEPIIIDDHRIHIIDQNPIPGSIKNDKDEVTFQTFGYNSTNKQSSFIKDISLNTSLTPEFSTMVTIGATANGGKVKGIDSTYFSKWNAGLTDRFNIGTEITELDVDKLNESQRAAKLKEYSDEFNKKLKEQIKNFNEFENIHVMGGHGSYNGRRSVRNDNLLSIKGDNIVPNGDYDQEQYIETKVNIWQSKKDHENIDPNLESKFKNNYFKYLVQAFGSNQTLVIDNGIAIDPNPSPKYLEFDSSFISKSKPSYSEYLRVINNELSEIAKAKAEKTKDLYSSNQIGFIPFNLGITMAGLSGIKIYNKINVDQSFLPKNYPSTLHFITTKVNHYIKDDHWETQLETMVLPKTTVPEYNKYKLEFEDKGRQNLAPEEDRGAKYFAQKGFDDDFYFLEGRKDDQRLTEPRALVFQSKYVETLELLDDIHPDVKNNFRNFFKALHKDYPGYHARVSAIYRTPSKSKELGETLGEGESVAKPGSSRHTWGAAIDFNLFTPGFVKGKGKALFKKGNYTDWKNTNIPDLAKSFGIEWGGAFSPSAHKEDAVHFYVPYPKEIVKENIANILSLLPSMFRTLNDIHPFDVKLYRKMTDVEIIGYFTNMKKTVDNMTTRPYGLRPGYPLFSKVISSEYDLNKYNK